MGGVGAGNPGVSTNRTKISSLENEIERLKRRVKELEESMEHVVCGYCGGVHHKNIVCEYKFWNKKKEEM